MAKNDNYKKINRSFVNPYNFVSINGNQIDRKDVRDVYESDEELHTGYLECELVTRTPLAIPDISKNSDIKEYKFYSIDGKNPAIPGSSLRGMIRSVYETVTDSCFSTMKENTHLSYHSKPGIQKAYNPGILELQDGKWILYKAKQEKIEDSNLDIKILKSQERCLSGLKDSKVTNFRTGDIVKYDKGKKTVEHEGKSYKIKYYVFVGEEADAKKYERVFRKIKENGKFVAEPVDEQELQQAMQLLEEEKELYRRENVNLKYPEEHTGYVWYERCKKNGLIPLWYNRKGRLKLSLACFGRIACENKLNDLTMGREACKNREHLCPACRLFGMARKEALGSHIRITDAVAKTNINMISNVELKALSNPKSSYFPFYTKSQKKGSVVESWDDDGIEIRGRKYYWHIPMAATNQAIYTYDKIRDKNVSDEMRSGKFELVDKKAVFSFRIYYDNITKQQLEELKWVICLGENVSNGNMCHKLGHGKPLGLGSVKICITSQWERKISLPYSYSIRKCDKKECNKNALSNRVKNSKQVKELQKIANFHSMDREIVEYPRIYNAYEYESEEDINKVAPHQWFSQYQKEKQTLPDILSSKQDLELSYYNYVPHKDKE